MFVSRLTFLNAIYPADGEDLNFLKKNQCCTAGAKPPDMDEKRQIQTHIMDTTLRNMVNLARYLGYGWCYGWCYGCGGVDVGKDFNRNGNTWAANTRPFWGTE
ncbi:physalysin, partial [Biomphalaria glabrata]